MFSAQVDAVMLLVMRSKPAVPINRLQTQPKLKTEWRDRHDYPRAIKSQVYLLKDNQFAVKTVVRLPVDSE